MACYRTPVNAQEIAQLRQPLDANDLEVQKEPRPAHNLTITQCLNFRPRERWVMVLTATLKLSGLCF